MEEAEFLETRFFEMLGFLGWMIAVLVGRRTAGCEKMLTRMISGKERQGNDAADPLGRGFPLGIGLRGGVINCVEERFTGAAWGEAVDGTGSDGEDKRAAERFARERCIS